MRKIHETMTGKNKPRNNPLKNQIQKKDVLQWGIGPLENLPTLLYSTLLLFTLYSFFCISAAMKHRSDNPIGAAASLPQQQLPTYGDISRQWRQTKNDMEKATPGNRVAKREIAKTVDPIDR